MVTLTAESHVEDHGSIIIFTGYDPEYGDLRFACDRRPALDIIEALQSGAESEINVSVEDWQVVG